MTRGLFNMLSTQKLCVVYLFLFLDTGRFTATLAQVVKFRTANAAGLVQYDRLDVGRIKREQTLNTYTVGYLTNGKSLRETAALALYHVALERLDTFFGTFNYFIINSNIIARFEFGEIFLTTKLLVYKS